MIPSAGLYYTIIMSSSYTFGQMIFEYFKWHYGRGFDELISIAKNFFGFLIHFFSFKLLLKTLFSPWKRIAEYYERGLHIESLLETLLVNLIMRALGLISRLAIIFLGLISIIVLLILSFASFIIWLLMPLVLLGFMLSAFFLIYASI